MRTRKRRAEEKRYEKRSHPHFWNPTCCRGPYDPESSSSDWPGGVMIRRLHGERRGGRRKGRGRVKITREGTDKREGEGVRQREGKIIRSQ